ncbi:MAG TPA: tetratricopeptide repeat protein [Phycisphaerae bacterium]|nr:tetratricopeptide repeat protein [Phycisphaerae bacterium]
MDTWKRHLRPAACAVLMAITALCLCGCKRDSAPRAEQDRRGDHRPLNVLLISSDTTRADHLGCYGHPRVRTPHVDRLAREGATFTQCISAAPLTLVSHSSMMTGLYPPVHGVRDNGSYRLPGNCRTLAEVLRDSGYATAAEVAAMVLNREFGLNQGFEQYHDTYTPRRVENVPDLVKYRVAEEISLGVIDLLHEHGNEPFFIFAHFFDAHQPYQPPEPFVNQYKEPYEAEIAYMDAGVGRILDTLDETGLSANTLVIFTGDHGESLWQHGEETHGAFIYDATLHVPLIMRCPQVIPAGKQIAAQVRLIDIAPTVLDYLDNDAMADIQGVSLRPLIAGDAADLDLTAYSESFYPVSAFGLSQLRSLRTSNWKYILAPKPELYDLRADPQEMHNVIATEPARADEMREQLRSLLAEAPPLPEGDDDARIQLPADALDNLRGLGYAGGPADTHGEVENELDLFEPRGADPKDYTDLITKVSHVLGLMQTDASKAEAGLRECIAAAPDPDHGFAWAFVSLAELLVKEERWDEAVEWYERALRRDPDNGQTLTGLGQALQHVGRTDDAIAVLEASVQVEPVLARSCYVLANALVDQNKLDEAVKRYRQALEIDPGYDVARMALARASWQLGNNDEAQRLYEEAIKRSPEDPAPQRELGNLLLSMNKPEAALPHLHAWAELAPDNATACVNIADVLRVQGKNDEAIASYRQALKIDPENVYAYDALGQLLLETGDWQAADGVLRRGLELAPDHANLANNLGWLLATAPIDALRDGAAALKWARVACTQTGEKNVNYLDTLAAAYAENGQFDEAIDVIQRAVKIVDEAGQKESADSLRTRIRQYRDHEPLRSPAGS